MDLQGFSKEQLKTAFAFQVAHLIVGADEVIHPDEIGFINEAFPPDRLAGLGLLERSTGEFNRAFEEAKRVALHGLKDLLDPIEKLELTYTFMAACEADGHVDAREVAVVMQAARWLGLDDDAVDRELAKLNEEPCILCTVDDDGIACEVSQAEILDSSAVGYLPKVAGPLGDIDGVLTVTVTHAEAEAQDDAGLDVLLCHLANSGQLLDAIGRLRLRLDGFDDNRHLFKQTAARRWMRKVARTRPWLPVWLASTDSMVIQLVASLAGFDTKGGEIVVNDRAIRGAVHCANMAIAWTRHRGSARTDHARKFLARFDIGELPDSFYEGAEALVDRFDAVGRVVNRD